MQPAQQASTADAKILRDLILNHVNPKQAAWDESLICSGSCLDELPESEIDGLALHLAYRIHNEIGLYQISAGLISFLLGASSARRHGRETAEANLRRIMQAARPLRYCLSMNTRQAAAALVDATDRASDLLRAIDESRLRAFSSRNGLL